MYNGLQLYHRRFGLYCLCFDSMLSTVPKNPPGMALESATKSSPAPAALICTFAPLLCMSVSAVCKALSVASAGRSELSLLSVGTFAQSVLQSQSTRHDPGKNNCIGGRRKRRERGHCPWHDFDPSWVSGCSLALCQPPCPPSPCPPNKTTQK